MKLTIAVSNWGYFAAFWNTVFLSCAATATGSNHHPGNSSVTLAGETRNYRTARPHSPVSPIRCSAPKGKPAADRHAAPSRRSPSGNKWCPLQICCWRLRHLRSVLTKLGTQARHSCLSQVRRNQPVWHLSASHIRRQISRSARAFQRAGAALTPKAPWSKSTAVAAAVLFLLLLIRIVSRPSLK